MTAILGAALVAALAYAWRAHRRADAAGRVRDREALAANLPDVSRSCSTTGES